MKFRLSISCFCKHFICSVLLLLPLSLFAKSLPKQQLIALGKAAFIQKTHQQYPSLKDYSFLGGEEEPLLAIFNFEDGFLVLAGDDASMPVLAYSPTGQLDPALAAPACRMWIEQYQNEIRTIRQSAAKPTDEIRQQWQSLTDSSPKEASVVVVSPLLTAVWNQNKFYNKYAPIDENAPAGYDSRTPNGCVAVAMAMILYYYRYPTQGMGSHTNYTDYGNYHVNFAGETYHYEAMEDRLSHYNNEVAKLIFHCATAVDMAYSPEGSGASSQSVPDALIDYFGYGNNCKYVYKGNTNNTTWRNSLKQELNNRRPVYYSGCNDEGCHAFVCDGYDSENYFHFNFGWGGHANGYYALTNTGGSTEAIGGFSSYQAMVRHIYPADELYPYFCHSQIIDNCLCGTLEDGSNGMNYLNNSDCTYIITGDSACAVTINFQYFETQSGKDFLKFWDGNPANDRLLLSLSGEMPTPPLYNFDTDSLYVTFTSDNSGTASGWRFDYFVSRWMASCNSKIFYQYSGNLTDGSGDAEYRSIANCIWKLRLPEATHITFTFNKFDISPEDELNFYDISSHPYTFLTSYSGNTLPPPVTFYHNKILLNFVTDNYLNGDGFSISWLADSLIPDNVGTKEFPEKEISFYPNPATNTLFLQLNSPNNPPEISIYDMSGRKVLFFTRKLNAKNPFKMDVSCLPNGFYTVILRSNDLFYREKIIIAR